MGIPWDGTGINCYVMGQTNMSHGQSWVLCQNITKLHIRKIYDISKIAITINNSTA